jgi:hypothetical protein
LIYCGETIAVGCVLVARYPSHLEQFIKRCESP